MGGHDDDVGTGSGITANEAVADRGEDEVVDEGENPKSESVLGFSKGADWGYDEYPLLL